MTGRTSRKKHTYPFDKARRIYDIHVTVSSPILTRMGSVHVDLTPILKGEDKNIHNFVKLSPSEQVKLNNNLLNYSKEGMIKRTSADAWDNRFNNHNQKIILTEKKKKIDR